MRSGMKIAALALFLILCAGCARRHRPLALPQQAQAPSLPFPSQTAELTPPLPPALPSGPSPSVILDTTAPPVTHQAAHAPHPVYRRPRPAVSQSRQQDTKSAPQSASNQQLAADGTPSASSPIGQLSATGTDGSQPDRRSITSLINSTEKDLNGIKRPLSAREQKTAAQIRAFILHARDSLMINDLDGARTLAVKAHLLVQELLKQQ